MKTIVRTSRFENGSARIDISYAIKASMFVFTKLEKKIMIVMIFEILSETPDLYLKIRVYDAMICYTTVL